MVLRNFYGWLYSAVMAQRTGYWQEGNATVINTSGSGITVGYSSSDSKYPTRTQSFADMGVYIGSGSTAPTYEDYCLEAQITTVSNTQTAYARVFGNAQAKGVLTYTGTYSGAETVTIREIAIYKNIYNASTAQTPVLFTRSLLENPITLEPGDGFNVQAELVLGAVES